MKYLIKIKDAVKLSKYTPDYLGQLVRAGKIDGKKEGGEWFVDQVSLLFYLDSVKKNRIKRSGLWLMWLDKKILGVSYLWLFLALGLLSLAYLAANQPFEALVNKGDFSVGAVQNANPVLIPGSLPAAGPVTITGLPDERGQIQISVTPQN